MAASYQSLNQDDEELFEQHSNGIDRIVRETFPSIPVDFQLKPVTIRKIRGCGMFYDFKIALSDGQFAKVSFHTGGYPLPNQAGQPTSEQHFTVDPTPDSSEYK